MNVHLTVTIDLTYAIRDGVPFTEDDLHAQEDALLAAMTARGSLSLDNGPLVITSVDVLIEEHAIH